MSRKKKVNITPTAGNVLIEPVEAEKKTESGIYLPESSEEKSQKGVVIAVGAAEKTEKGTKKSPVKVGDTVIYKQWGGNEVKFKGKEYLFAKFEDILAIIK